MKTIALIILIIIIPVLIFVLPGKDHRHSSYSYHEEQKIEEKNNEEETDEKDEDIKDDKDDAEKEGKSGSEDQKEDTYFPSGNDDGGQDNPGEDPLPEVPPEPIYPYFREGNMLICMGCYKPFADVYALNAHQCEGFEENECVHEWEAEYHDVWIEAIGHYEYGVVEEAYDEAIYEERCVCRKCGEVFQSADEAANHIIAVHCNEGSWTVADVITGYIHHDAVYGDVFVIDVDGHWERQVYRYHCIKCGEIRYPE